MTDKPRIESAEQAEFRAYCRDWLKKNHPGDPPVPIPQSAVELRDPEALAWLQDWQQAAYEAGLVGVDYDAAYGGGGREHCQFVANEELQRARTPFFPNIVGLGMAGPTIYHHAQDDVKRELLPGLLSGREMWCQGFSEPGAGSDLASLQTSATRDGDNWIINGHKVWTSLAHFADWMILLARTGKEDKYNGLTYFVVPIRLNLGKCVTVRPLIKITGGSGFNQVMFDDLVIPDRYRLDAEGAGWKVAMTTLTHERGAGSLVTPAAGGMATRGEDAVETSSPLELIRLARQSPRGGMTAADDPLLRDELVKLLIRDEAQRQNQRRGRVPALTDGADRLALQNKVVGSELRQDLAQLAYQVTGAASTLNGVDPNAPADGEFTIAYMNSFGSTIAAGTSEIQRNILGERVLGLPKSK